jgi:hypothetical protein
VRRATLETAERRNRYVAALAERVLVIHAAPGGKLEALGWGKAVYTLESEHNRGLIERGRGCIGKPGAMHFASAWLLVYYKLTTAAPVSSPARSFSRA